MSAKGFPVALEPEEDGGYVVTCPIIPGCYSQGDSLQEALDNIREAIELCLEDYRERGKQLRIRTRSRLVMSWCKYESGNAGGVVG